MRKDLLDWLSVLAVATTLAGCAADTSGTDEEETESSSEDLSALKKGVNSDGCRRSPYNCTLNPGHGQRVTKPNGDETWDVDFGWLASRGYVDAGKAYLPVVDGDGALMGKSTKASLTFNYGQTRRMNGITYVFALSAGIGASGWVPLDAMKDAALLRSRVGEVNARAAGLKPMGCYEVASTYDPKFDHYKVVKGATDKDAEEPNDYLPNKLANGRAYMNLAFSAPGSALGAPGVDKLPAGTRFRRLDVPTWESPDLPSLEVTLYAKAAGATAYTKAAGKMKFVYGSVKTKDGTVRNGWMALDGLVLSSGCP